MSRKTSTRAVIRLYDTSALTDGNYVTNSIKPFCDINTLNYEVHDTINYATCEDNVFLLDGNFLYFPDSPQSENFSYWSNSMSDENGDFSTNPTITREFTYKHSSVGLTLNFEANYPLPITVNIKFFRRVEGVYQLIANGNFNVDNNHYFCDIPAEEYHKLIIEFVKIQPYQYARVNTIEYGKELEYSSESDKNISKARVLEDIDITSSEVKIGTSSITVIDNDGLFSITNPNGVYKFLQQRQVIQIYEKIDDVEYQMSNHYLKEWSTESNTISTFECQDILGVLDNSTYKGNLFVNETVSDIVDDLLTDFVFGDYYVADDIKDIVLNGIIAPCTYREAIQQVMFACNGTVEASRDGSINFYKASETTSTTINKNRVFMSPKYSITQGDLVTGVRVTAHNYVRDTETSQAYKATLGSGVYNITFNNPYDTLTATNCTIIESGYFYAQIRVANESEAVITGYKYNDNTTIYEKYLPDLPLGTDVNVKEVQNATLVSKANANTVANWLYEYYKYRLTHKLKIVCEDEKAGLYCAIENNKGLASSIIKSLDIDLTGGFLGTIESIGYALAIQDHDYMQQIGDGYALYSGDELGLI